MAREKFDRCAIVALTQGGDVLANRLKSLYPGASVYSKHAGTLREPLARWLKREVSGFDGLILICSLGIVMRSLSGLLHSKKNDPALLVLDEKGRHVISALSGHRGGANAWAQEVAEKIGAMPVITTASDSNETLSLDLLGQEGNWVLEGERCLTKLSALIVNGRPMALLQEAGERLTRFPANVTVFSSWDALALAQKKFEGFLLVTDRERSWPAKNNTLWYRPRTLCLGIGCERGVSEKEIQEAITILLKKNALAFDSLREIVSLDLKKDERGLCAFAAKHDLPLRFFSAGELSQIPVPNPSLYVAREVGTPSVAEAAALKASGAKELLATKHVHAGKITLAVARWQPVLIQGKVMFIGAGPGDPELLTVKARKCIAKADVIFYAGSLIPGPLIRSLPAMAKKINTATMDLETIRSAMLGAVREGKHVVRLQSGDLSLYSAVGEQAAFLDEQNIEYGLIPGVSSFQAAAARLKKELTIPGEVQTIILTRAEGNTQMPSREALRSLAQHRASLCIFLAGRLVAKVQEDLIATYPPNTPAVIVHRLTWPDEKIFWTTIEGIADIVGKNKLLRTTLILVGSALGAKRERSRLYHPGHEHLFRKAAIR